MKITIAHCRSLGYCAPGVKEFCRRYGISLHDLCGEGVDEEILLNTKDAMAINAVKEAYKCEAEVQRNK